ncbi:hypothetical protein F7725_004426 [Dissostichus mawsoni]|uniref:Uncharacterized protein n=1 Tax=Dissostichus mawsoni TaxID=36200 RepID=A0A7J5XIN4_DISMA|nr:hypothetical protein F7725_004426 [Dissostichus mawsoni]
MPPKAAKKGSAKKPNASGASAVGKNWEAGVMASLCVSGGREKSREEKLTLALSVAAQKPQRKLFSFLTWENTVARSMNWGIPKQNDLMKPHVTEPAKVLLDAGDEIPCDLMANI